MLLVSESFVSVYKAIQNNKEFCSEEFIKYQDVSPLHMMGVFDKMERHEQGLNKSGLQHSQTTLMRHFPELGGGHDDGHGHGEGHG